MNIDHFLIRRQIFLAQIEVSIFLAVLLWFASNRKLNRNIERKKETENSRMRSKNSTNGVVCVFAHISVLIKIDKQHI